MSEDRTVIVRDDPAVVATDGGSSNALVIGILAIIAIVIIGLFIWQPWNATSTTTNNTSVTTQGQQQPAANGNTSGSTTTTTTTTSTSNP